MAVYIYPVCSGKGIVPQDFYNLNPAPTTAVAFLQHAEAVMEKE